MVLAIFKFPECRLLAILAWVVRGYVMLLKK